MRPLSDPRLFAKSCLAATMGLALTLSAAAPASAVQPPADETGIVTSGDTAKDVLSPGMKKAEGNIAVFVQFKGKGAYEQTQSAAVLANKQAPTNKQAEVQAIKTQVQSQAQAAARQSSCTPCTTPPAAWYSKGMLRRSVNLRTAAMWSASPPLLPRNGRTPPAW